MCLDLLDNLLVLLLCVQDLCLYGATSFGNWPSMDHPSPYLQPHLHHKWSNDLFRDSLEIHFQYAAIMHHTHCASHHTPNIDSLLGGITACMCCRISLLGLVIMFLVQSWQFLFEKLTCKYVLFCNFASHLLGNNELFCMSGIVHSTRNS